MRGIAIREELTDEWKNRGANENKDFEILTAEISKATFGITPSEYKNLIKGLKRENLRDHMDDFELIFTMLGERSSVEIHKTENSYGTEKLKKDASRGGRIAGIARTELEKEIALNCLRRAHTLYPQEITFQDAIQVKNNLANKGKYNTGDILPNIILYTMNMKQINLYDTLNKKQRNLIIGSSQS